MESIFYAISNFRQGVSNWFSQFYTMLSWFFDNVLDLLAYAWSIITSVWYWLTTLLSWVYDLIEQLFTSWIF